MDMDNLQMIWKKQQELLDRQKSINERLLIKSIKESSRWLAPNFIVIPILLYCIAMCVWSVYDGFMTWIDVTPILLMCCFGLIQMSWQTALKQRIKSMEGGVIGVVDNMLKYRRLYAISKKSTIFVGVAYIAWFAWFMHARIMFELPIIISVIFVTIVLSIVSYKIRNRKTENALKEIDTDLQELQDFKR